MAVSLQWGGILGPIIVDDHGRFSMGLRRIVVR